MVTPYYDPAQQGQPAQQFYGGAPAPMGQPGLPQPDIKWSGLAIGGAFKIPIIAFIGRLTAMVEDTTTQYGLRIVEKYDQVQILESPSPWSWATIDLSIKYSDREESGWGRHVGSAKALGLAQNAVNLDQARVELIGKIYELRQKDESYGEDQKTGQAFHGDVWRFVRIVTGIAQPPQAQYVQPTVVSAPAPAPAVPPLAQQPAAVVQPQPAAPTSSFSAVLADTDTAPVRAKKLLHGRALNEFLAVALTDEKVKADATFVNSIFDQSFIVGLRSSGQVEVGTDGKFNVVA